MRSVLVWTAVAVAGAVAWTVLVLALSRGETVSALWIPFAALCAYAIAYRSYARFIATKVLRTDDRRATPAERLHNGIDYDVTDRRVLFGHHFAAIAGAGPLVGPVLAAQMGYLPGTIWIVVGVIFAGAVQELTIPIALVTGLYLRRLRPGRVLEATGIGVVLLLAIVGGGWVQDSGLAGSLFPFVFTTTACGALSGFHALIASGTTPKMVAKESQVRLIGYGGMLVESFVAISALIAACVIDQGLYFAMNSPAGATGGAVESAATFVQGFGFDTSAQDLAAAAAAVQEPTLISRTGGAPTLAVGISQICGDAFGGGLPAFWYHFAIMFEALFTLTAVDAGTRVGRSVLRDTIGNVRKKFGDLSWRPGNAIASAIVVGLWGSVLHIGVTDPLGGVDQLFPLFGIANQPLAAIAPTLGTVLLIKHGKLRYAWVTGVPLAWDLIVTMTASWQKVVSDVPAIGYFAQAQRYRDARDAGQLLAPARDEGQLDQVVFNSTLNGVLQSLFAVRVLVVVVNAVVVIARAVRAGGLPTTEEPAVPSSLVEPAGLFATAAEKRALADHERLVGSGGGQQ